MADLSQATWRKSTRSCEDGCVEVALGDRQVAVRDSKDRTGPELVFSFAEWNAFVDGVRGGEFDVLSFAERGVISPLIPREEPSGQTEGTEQAPWLSQAREAVRNGIRSPGWIPWTLAPINIAAQIAETPTANVLVINVCALVSQAMAVAGLLILERFRSRHAERMQELELDKVHAREEGHV
jgi:hypothetical protein